MPETKQPASATCVRFFIGLNAALEAIFRTSPKDAQRRSIAAEAYARGFADGAKHA